MAPPPKIPPETWAAIRAEYEAGHVSTRELARKYGLSEKAIRKRAADGEQPGGAWRRDDLGPSIDQAAQRAMARAAKRAARKPRDEDDSPHDGPQNESPHGDSPQNEGPQRPLRTFPVAPLKPSYRNPTTLEMADPAFRAALREQIVDSVAQALADANTQHLENRVGPLKTLFVRLVKLVGEAMSTPDPEDAEAVQRQGQAQAALIVGRTDSLGAHMQVLIKLAESIQAQERKALGVDDRAKRVELSGPGGAPIQTENASVMFDLTKLSTADMEHLYEAALILEGGRERPPIPLPPGDE